ncbi:glycoside hydrolase family 3 protein [Pseudoduganella lutea]|uniref:Beta-D-glucoside glucohydrolase n=1 Tax=Pseudoduganella lutea TaxID=321985 RepID=A0A4P6L5J3_9BURK|nr:glycoside hydrolase family 3 C-terminal domain-containing protein [Pseudoduganella lutea]QBE66787.1 glycosyl hydrolase family 3 [Pseudoduganella lutea]
MKRSSVLPGALPAIAVLCHAVLPLAATAGPVQGNEVEARVGAMIDNMSLAQKFGFIRVNDGHMLPVLPSQGLPGTVAYDSSMGVHVGLGTFGAQFPSQSALAATWSINRAQQFGLALGYETRQAGAQQMLSPGLNMFRTPFNGRNAEYVSGEDPFLGAVLGPAITNAIQAQGIQAAAKHYVANDQEANRHLLDVTVDERTLREIYLPGFESTVKNANPASVMCAFNKINGDYGCESHHLITEVLKGEWGFRGFVMSDFNSIHHPQKAAWAGADLDMPSGLAFTDQTMYDLVYSNQVPMNVLDDKVRRNLRAMVSYGFDKTLPVPTPLDTTYGDAASLAVAREGIVLLQNDSGKGGSMPLLPLATNARVAVIGDLAQQSPASPFGTAWAPANRYVTELSGLRQLNVDPANVTFIPALSLNPAQAIWYQPGSTAAALAPGLKAEYFTNTTLAGSPATTRVEPGVALDFMAGSNVTAAGTSTLAGIATGAGAFSARFTGTIRPTVTGAHVFKVRADGAYKLWVNGELVIDFDGVPVAGDVVNALAKSGKTAQLKAGSLYSVKLEYRRVSGAYFPVLGGINGIQMSWASLSAPGNLASYDAVVVAVGKNAEHEGEGIDVAYELPEFQSELVASVAKVNANTIVVVHGGGPSEMKSWSKKTAAVLQAWYPGQFGGQALAEILYGTVNPSGKLPVTIGGTAADYPTTAGYGAIADYQPSGTFADASTNQARKKMAYAEGVFMGYRGFDKTGVKPLYPFGFGLSYTTFGYSGLALSGTDLNAGSTIDATFTLTNRGTQAGYEVAQLYVRPAAATVARPKQELKGFAKVFLRAGESKTVTIPVDARSLSFYDVATGSWQVPAGKYTVHVGSSSVDLPLKTTLSVKTALRLSTGASNPLPAPVREAVQVAADRAY